MKTSDTCCLRMGSPLRFGGRNRWGKWHLFRADHQYWLAELAVILFPARLSLYYDHTTLWSPLVGYPWFSSAVYFGWTRWDLILYSYTDIFFWSCGSLDIKEIQHDMQSYRRQNVLSVLVWYVIQCRCCTDRVQENAGKINIWFGRHFSILSWSSWKNFNSCWTQTMTSEIHTLSTKVDSLSNYVC